ncbi:MAG TPA: PAC2 family protein [Verrucomicrobiae bacterium]|nr:PAC2 family protein [Verrucomicrobiae bacterium]
MSSIPSTIIRTISNINNLQKNKSILIAGFPGPGLVGSISTSYIIDKLNMHQIACVESEYISPGVIYVDGKLRHPFRLYANSEGNVCVIVCEAPIMINGIHSVLGTVIDWAIKNTIQEVLVLDGIAVPGIPRSDRQPILLGSTEMDEKIDNIDNENLDVPANQCKLPSNFNRSIIEDANKKYTTFIGGIAGGLLSACLSYQIPCTAILIPSSSGIPDPEGAAILIESYNSIIKNDRLKINPSQLKEQGQLLKQQLEQIIKSEQQQRDGSITDKDLMYG